MYVWMHIYELPAKPTHSRGDISQWHIYCKYIDTRLYRKAWLQYLQGTVLELELDAYKKDRDTLSEH